MERDTEGPESQRRTRDRAAREIQMDDLMDDPVLKRLRRGRFGARPCRVVGDFHLLRRLGRGGFGDVFLSIHPRLGHRVAIKLLRPNATNRDPTLGDRFLREAQITAQLSKATAHLVSVTDVDIDPTSHLYFLVMEYVDGLTAADWCGAVRGAAPVERDELECLEVVIAATDGLSVAHRQGVVHRDVKPENILIPCDGDIPLLGMAKLADLGLARSEDAAPSMNTAVVTAVGTPGFASPEQLRSPRDAVKASDVFGMGATLYALLTGHSPFAAENPERGHAQARLAATLRNERVPLERRRADASPLIVELIETCLDTAPDARYPDAIALLEALYVCRNALQTGDAVGPSTTQRIRAIRYRPEEGRSIQSGIEPLHRSGPIRLVLHGGPPGAIVRLRPVDGTGDELEFQLDASGQLETEAVVSGKFALIADHPDFHQFEAPLVILRQGTDAHCMLTMREREGYLVVASTPSGAAVVIDGTEVATTPTQRLALAPGAHELELRLAGFGRCRAEVAIRGGIETDVGTITLPAMGRVDMSHLAEDVGVLIDGRPVGDGETVAPGAHTLTIQRAGYESQLHQVELGASETLAPAPSRWRPNPWKLISRRENWVNACDEDRERCGVSLSERLPAFEFCGVEAFSGGELAVFLHGPTGLQFVLIPGDSFLMGSPSDTADRRADERPHRVALAPFLIACTTVTQGAWERRADPAGYHFRGAELPVESVSWNDARAFCEGLGLSLPTEAQWEYACRGGQETTDWFGDDAAAAGRHAWLRSNAGYRTQPVAQLAANPFGLHDVLGNVWEWCADGYGEYPFDAVANPGGSSTAAYRVFRGGSWRDTAANARPARRGAYLPNHRDANLGFRPALPIRAEDMADLRVSESSLDRAPPSAGTRQTTT